MRTPTINLATRVCKRCGQHRRLTGGKMVASGTRGKTEFICGDCWSEGMETRYDNDARWLAQRLGRPPDEEEEELFCELVQRLWTQGLSDDEAREEAFRRQF